MVFGGGSRLREQLKNTVKVVQGDQLDFQKSDLPRAAITSLEGYRRRLTHEQIASKTIGDDGARVMGLRVEAAENGLHDAA